MLHLWGRITSINVRKVVWAVQECDAPFTRTDAGRTFVQSIRTAPEKRDMAGDHFTMADIPIACEVHR